MSEGKILHLTLKKKWFDMIASGEKKEEYREIKYYWLVKLMDNVKLPGGFASLVKGLEEFKKFDTISANNGYSKDCPNIKWKHKGISIGEGREEWGAEKGKEYFILKIGEIFT